MAASVEHLDALVGLEQGGLTAEQLGLLQREIGIATWVWDVAEDSARWYGDPSALLGFSPGTFAGRFEQCLEHIHPEDRPRAYETLIACLKGIQPEYRTEGRVIWPNGSVHWLACYGRGFYGPDGRAHRLAGVIRSISDAERTERLLRIATEKFEAIFAAIPDAIGITRESDATLVEVNDAWVAFTGHAREAVLGRTVLSLGLYEVPADRDHVVQSLVKGLPVFNHPTRYIRADGRIIDVRLSAVRVEVGGELFVVWSWSDMSAQRRAEQIARQSLQKFEALFETSPEGIVVTRPRDRTIVDINDAALRLIGIAREEAIGARLRDVMKWLNEGDLERFRERLLRGERLAGELQAFRRPDGAVVEAIWSASRIEVDGEIYFVMSMRDMTEVRRAEAQVRELNVSLERRVAERTRELEAANRELDAFSYSVSHDLRAPLHAITGFAEIVRVAHGAALSGKALHYFERIEHNARQMDTLIGELLEFSRAWRVPLNRACVDMRELVGEVLQSLRMEYEHRARIEIADLPSARGDRSLLRQVWSNLIGNALKFSRGAAQPHIRIRGEQREDEVEYFVTDNGAGFDQRYADKLFGVFQRLHSSSEFEGSGVGLALVQRIVTRHGGRVAAEGSPGQGATFRFVLPLRPAEG
jgi:PAS domain S-box-containing protein